MRNIIDADMIIKQSRDYFETAAREIKLSRQVSVCTLGIRFLPNPWCSVGHRACVLIENHRCVRTQFRIVLSDVQILHKKANI
jgi:hypothetical protein